MKDHTDSEAASESADDGDDAASDSSHTEPSKPASPRVREEEDEEEPRPQFGGLGLGAGKGGIGSSKAGIGSSKADIGSTSAFASFQRGGIGSSQPTAPESSASPSPAPALGEDFPTAFGASRAQRSFVRKADASTGTSRSGTPLTTAERQHFSKLAGTFGARMLEKMGWQAGSGLGTTGEGIVTPVESKLRPKGMGLAFKGFKEKTEQSKAEARRRGEIVSDDDEESKAASRKARKSAKSQAERSEAWKKPKRGKTKVEHKTYEEIIAEAGQETPQAGLGQIIDATGATVSFTNVTQCIMLTIYWCSSEKSHPWPTYLWHHGRQPRTRCDFLKYATTCVSSQNLVAQTWMVLHAKLVPWKNARSGYTPKTRDCESKWMKRRSVSGILACAAISY